MVYDTRFELAIRDDRFVIVETTMMTIENTKKKKREITQIYIPRTYHAQRRVAEYLVSRRQSRIAS